MDFRKAIRKLGLNREGVAWKARMAASILPRSIVQGEGKAPRPTKSRVAKGEPDSLTNTYHDWYDRLLGLCLFAR